MAASAKSKSILAGMQSSEWNKFMKSYQGALKDYNADVADLDAKQKSESDWMAGIGKLAFIAGTYIMDALIPGTGFGLRTAGIVAGAGAISLASAGATDLWHGGVVEGPEDAAAHLEAQGYDVYDPLFGKTRAGELEERIQIDKEMQVTAADKYEGDVWRSQWLQTAGDMATYIGLQAGSATFLGKGTNVKDTGIPNPDPILRT